MVEVLTKKEEYIAKISQEQCFDPEIVKDYLDKLEEIHQFFQKSKLADATDRISKLLCESKFGYLGGYNLLYTCAFIVGVNAKVINHQGSHHIIFIDRMFGFLNGLKAHKNNPKTEHYEVIDPLERLLTNFSSVTDDEMDSLEDYFITNNPIFEFLRS